jgi:hypothetical protein
MVTLPYDDYHDGVRSKSNGKKNERVQDYNEMKVLHLP